MKIHIKRVLIGCGAVAVVAFVVAGFASYLTSSFEKSLQAVTDVSRYSEIKAMWPAHLVSHFPEKAPDSAVFHFQPGFLQGGSSLQLKVAMSQAEVAAELSNISDRILATYHGGDVNDHRNLTNGIPTTLFFTSETDTKAFPKDYAIMVIEAHDHNGGFAWNHGSTAGLAISTQRSIAVYWAESW
jgi:hypothetical protein